MKAEDVTVDMALEAFDETGLEPKSGTVYDRFHALGACGCLLGALYIKAHPEKKDQFGIGTKEVVEDLFGGEDYAGYLLASGFDSGFDNLPSRLDICSPFAVGYTVGQILRKRHPRKAVEK